MIDVRDRSERLFLLLLRLYPRTHRDRFAAELLDTFRRERTAARGASAARFWLWILADIMVTAARRWLHAGAFHRGMRQRRPLLFSAVHLRDATRALTASPVVTTVIVLSLALGIGANTAIFSVLDTLLLQSLPVQQAERLVHVHTGTDRNVMTKAMWEQLRARKDLFAGSFAWFPTQLRVTSNAEAQRVDGLVVSGDFFDVLGVRASLGRVLMPADDARAGQADAVAIISYGFWQERFGGNPDAIGRTITLGSVPFRIVGVTPAAFYGVEVGRRYDVAITIAGVAHLDAMRMLVVNPDVRWLRVMARLPDDQEPRTVEARLRAVEAHIRTAADPSMRASPSAEHFELLPAATGSSALRRAYARPLVVLMTAVVCVLLIACANIANLLLARSTARRHELSVRLALGASRGSLVRQLMTESLLLSAAGALLGIVFGVWSSRLLVQQLSLPGAQVQLALGLDARLLAFTAVLAVGTALVFGVAPAFRATRVQPIDALAQRGRGLTSRSGWSRALVVIQLALSLVLLTGAGLLVRTFASLTTLELGFDRDPVLVARMSALRAEAHEPETRLALYRDIVQRIEALPAVETAALSVLTPVISGDAVVMGMSVPGGSARPDDDAVIANQVSPGWFATLGTRLLMGRDFDEDDAAGSARVVIVNETAVRQFFAGENPLGRTIRAAPSPDEAEVDMRVVGVVRDAIAGSLRERARPARYTPLAQLRDVPAAIDLIIRTRGKPTADLTRDVLAAVSALDANVALTMQPLRAAVDDALSRERLVATLSGFFGLLALLLAGLGIYGLLSYAVNARRMEIGIRLALGCTPQGAATFVFGDAGRLLAGGLLIGALAALWVMQFLKKLLYDLQPHDPATMILAGATLLTVGVLAAWLPARRAARGDPVTVLRSAP